MHIELSVSWVMNPSARASPEAKGATSTGLSNRRFSPTKAFRRSFVDEYSSRTKGSRSSTLSTTESICRVMKLDARNPNSVMSATVATKPTPGIGMPSQPSIVAKTRTQT